MKLLFNTSYLDPTQWADDPRKKVIIADARLSSFAKPLQELLGAELLFVPSGERAKTRRVQESIQNALFEKGYGKDTLLIALGGGTTTDLVGFVASIYMRGLPFISIPTTLLGMVDAAIGGKTAINTSYGKNLIGTFYHPEKVVIDVKFLQTLPQREWENGIAEVFKIALVFDPTLLEDPLSIEKAILAKLAIVEKDPKDVSIRRILNFGHTIGHALEALSQFKMAHGKAVALGSMVESYLSMDLGYLKREAFEKIQFPFPLKLPKSYNRNRFLSYLLQDKKKEGGKARFVLIEEIGKAVSFNEAYVRPVDTFELLPTLEWMEKIYA